MPEDTPALHLQAALLGLCFREGCRGTTPASARDLPSLLTSSYMPPSLLKCILSSSVNTGGRLLNRSSRSRNSTLLWTSCLTTRAASTSWLSCLFSLGIRHFDLAPLPPPAAPPLLGVALPAVELKIRVLLGL